METFGRVLAFGMGVNFFLLAYQVDNVTGVFGWIFGALLCMAVLMSFIAPKRYPEKRGTHNPNTPNTLTSGFEKVNRE